MNFREILGLQAGASLGMSDSAVAVDANIVQNNLPQIGIIGALVMPPFVQRPR